MNWKDKLNQIEEQIKKEEKNGHIVSPTCVGNRNSIGSNSNVHRVSVYKQIKEREEKSMITIEGALKDLEAIEKETTDTGSKAIVKALKVVVKMLSTIRSNQLLTDADKQRIAAEKVKRQTAVEKK